MRILQINTENTWRGGERQTLYSARGLIKRGIKVAILVTKNSPLSKKAQQEGIEVIQTRGFFHTLVKIFLARTQFDIFHAQAGKAHTQAVMTKYLHKKPVIYTRRVDFVPTGFASMIKYRLTDQVIAISEKISSILDTNKLYKKAPVIYSAIESKTLDLKRASNLKKTLRIGNSKIVGIIAAIEEHKDPFLTLNVAKEILERRSDIHFIHFGSGKLEAEFKKFIKHNSLEGWYHFMGHYDNVEDFYSIMDIFLMTSKMEGLGSSVIDAFNNEVFVVSTNAGGLKELVEGRGALCNIGDLDCLVSEIENAISMNKDKIAIIRKAKSFCKKNFLSDKMVEKYIEIYKTLL